MAKSDPYIQFGDLQAQVFISLNANLNGTGVFLFKQNGYFGEYKDTPAIPFVPDAIKKAIDDATAGDFILVRGVTTPELNIKPKDQVNMIWQDAVLDSSASGNVPNIKIDSNINCNFYGNLRVRRSLQDIPCLQVTATACVVKMIGDFRFESVSSTTTDIELDGVTTINGLTTSGKGIRIYGGDHHIVHDTNEQKTVLLVSAGNVNYTNNKGKFSTSIIAGGGNIKVRDSYLRYCEMQGCDYNLNACDMDDEDSQNQSVIWQDSSNGQLWHSNMNAPVAEYGVYMNTGSFKSRYNVFNVLGSGSPQYCIYDNVGSNANNWYSSSNVGDSGVTGQTVAVGTL